MTASSPKVVLVGVPGPLMRAQLECAEISRGKQGVKSGFALCMTLPEWRELQGKASSKSQWMKLECFFKWPVPY